MFRPQYMDSRLKKVGTRQRRAKPWLFVMGICSMAVALYAFVSVSGSSYEFGNLSDVINNDSTLIQNGCTSNVTTSYVYRKRLSRNDIPKINFVNKSYREVLNDSNYVQLSSARACGIDPSKVGNPAHNPSLVPIFSSGLYRVDTMYHAMPFLVPEAVLLLDYIALRFNQLMAEEYPQMGKHRIIVTSALRTEKSERMLRRVNRNATDTSCHIYGTTFDISAQRYEHFSGVDTVVEYCKMALAKALYELRYEGLCYVKYERGSCFHITLRTTQYEGNGNSHICKYTNPGSPEYIKTKAAPRPKPRVQQQNNVSSKDIKPASVKTKKSSKDYHRKVSAVDAQSVQPTAKKEGVSLKDQGISDRERLSLEYFEKRNH